jgi:hypothetical protein
LNAHGVEYLLVGGYAVSYHGYPRATADIDIWVAVRTENAERIVAALKEFGFDVPGVEVATFLESGKVIRMGESPIRIEVLTGISGVEFEECYQERLLDELDGVEVSIISLRHLKENKRASGRLNDLNDLEHLP